MNGGLKGELTSELRAAAGRISSMRAPASDVKPSGDTVNVRRMTIKLVSVLSSQSPSGDLIFHFDMAASLDEPTYTRRALMSWNQIQQAAHLLSHAALTGGIVEWNRAQLAAAAAVQRILSNRVGGYPGMNQAVIDDLQKGIVDAEKLEPYFTDPALAA